MILDLYKRKTLLFVYSHCSETKFLYFVKLNRKVLFVIILAELNWAQPTHSSPRLHLMFLSSILKQAVLNQPYVYRAYGPGGGLRRAYVYYLALFCSHQLSRFVLQIFQ